MQKSQNKAAKEKCWPRTPKDDLHHLNPQNWRIQNAVIKSTDVKVTD